MRKNLVISLVIMSVLSCLVSILVHFQKQTTQKEKSNLIEKHVEGIVIKINDRGRDHYYLKVQNNLDSLYEFDLVIGWFLTENKIGIGDSIAKEENSNAIQFYKKKNSQYEFCCEYIISL